MKFRYCLLLLLVVLTNSCKKFVQIDPPVTEISGSTVYSNNASATAAMLGLYSSMMESSNFSDGPGSIGFLCGLSADELKLYWNGSPTYSGYYGNALTSQIGTPWALDYGYIHTANAILEGVEKSNGLSPTVKDELTGEAKFMRAFLYFYLVNLFGDVPLITTTDYHLDMNDRRTAKDTVYQQIIADLTDAQKLLTNAYKDATGNTTGEKVRPNRVAATALLARVYLYTGDWPNAFIQSDSVLTNPNYSLPGDLNQVFLANSAEAIWQLQPVNPAYNTFSGFFFVLTSPPGTARFPVALSPFLTASFEPGDSRFANWVGRFPSGVDTFYFPYKYKVGQRYQPVTEYVMVLRLAEQYLIRAEAEANCAGGGVGAAIADLNAVRQRAGLPAYTGATDVASVLSAILHERQVELFTEWGHRWLDLRRTGSIDAVMSVVTPQKGGAWASYKAWLPIPIADLQTDHNLTQNDGY